MGQPCSLGIDLGTGSVKVALVSQTGDVLARSERIYDTRSERPEWAEIEPNEWESAAREAVTEVLAAGKHEVLAVGIDGQMHGAVLADIKGRALRPAILWPDTRAEEELALWRDLPTGPRRALANPITAGMTGPILAWLARHEPTATRSAHRLLLPKDWLRSTLVPGSFVTDQSDASATLMWDFEKDGWSDDVLAVIGVEPELLPRAAASGDSVGAIGAAEARQWGLPDGVPVAVGCGDAAATLIGADLPQREVLITVGSGAQVIVDNVPLTLDKPVRHHTYKTAYGGTYAMVAIMNAGIALRRVLQLLRAGWEDLYRAYDRTRRIPTFIPFLSGERFPDVLPSGSGAWIGIGLSTEREDLLAAALEGLCFTIARGIHWIPSDADSTITIAGGGSRADVLIQMLADLLQRPVKRTDLSDASVVGAARLGLTAAGHKWWGAASGGATGTVFEPYDAGPLAERFDLFKQRVA